MSFFNNSEFNNMLFGEGSSLPSENIKDVSATINCSSTVNSELSVERPISAQVNGSTTFNTNITNIKPISAIVNGRTIVNSSNSENVNFNRVIGLSATIDSSSNGTIFDASFGIIHPISTDVTGETIVNVWQIGKFLFPEPVISSSTVTSNINVIYSALSDFTGSSDVTINTFNVDYIISGDVTGSTSVDAAVGGGTVGFAATFDLSSTVTAETLDVYKRLQPEITSGETTVTVNSYIIESFGVNTFESTTNVTSNLNITSNLGGAIFESGWFVYNPLDLGKVIDVTGKTEVTAQIQAPDQITGKRRRVTYVFEVDNGRIPSNIIETHYKIFKFYNSLSNVQQTLDYVNRVASQEIRSYDINATYHRQWNSNTDLYNLKTGDRGVVQKDATGIFLGKDKQFAIYRGPKVVNGEIVS